MADYRYVELEDGAGFDDIIGDIDGEIVEPVLRNGWTIGLIVKEENTN